MSIRCIEGIPTIEPLPANGTSWLAPPGGDAVTLLLVGVATVPLAAYFLWLGAANCRRHPKLTTGLHDLLALVAGFTGLLAIGPAFALAIAWQEGRIASTSVGVIAVLGAAWFVMAAAREQRSHVIYNIGEIPFWNALENALEDLGIAYRRRGNSVSLQDADLQLTVQPFAAMRNVTLYHEGDHAADRMAPVIDRLKARLATVDTGVSLAGGLFLAVGAAVLMVPVYLALQDTDVLASLFGG